MAACIHPPQPNIETPSIAPLTSRNELFLALPALADRLDGLTSPLSNLQKLGKCRCHLLLDV